VAAYVADVRAARVSRGFGDTLSLAEAECARGKLVRELPPVLGPVVGYKAAFTNPASRSRVGLTSPSWGVMFGGMMLESGASVPARFGALPSYEPDLVAVVKDGALASARSPLEALRYLSEVAPFIELPDLMLEGRPSGPAIVATNIGARGGVLGPRIRVEAGQAFLDALGRMTVVTSDDRGRELGRAQGSLLMEHPVNSALWLARTLEEQGVALRAGDLLSLGGFLPPAPTQAGTTITVRYLGLPGDPSVAVRFE
jgi:2-oxo-hept-3-ene-1,7-dioate hydratase